MMDQDGVLAAGLLYFTLYNVHIVSCDDNLLVSYFVFVIILFKLINLSVLMKV